MNSTHTQEQIDEARFWLNDCGCPEWQLDDRSDAEIIAEVDAQADGGWPAFLLAIS